LLGANYRELKEIAITQKRSLSNLAFFILERKYSEMATSGEPLGKDLQIHQSLLPLQTHTMGAYGTFAPNHQESIHRWYPYIEGFSSSFVQSLLGEFAGPNCRIYDPFAGTGTTVTVSAINGLLPLYSEINPFMRLVIECKTNEIRDVVENEKELRNYFEKIDNFARINLPTSKSAQGELKRAFGDRQYYKAKRLREIVSIRRAITACKSRLTAFRNFARLALGSIAVACSEMKRAADLRYRTPKELLPDKFSVIDEFQKKTSEIYSDICSVQTSLPTVTCLSESALDEYHFDKYIDLVVTSPPYLNGTNYFRNTKIELWLTGFISCERELRSFRDKAMTAGINNVFKGGRPAKRLPIVDDIVSKLDDVAYDKRIPELARRYFSDSILWINNVYRLLRPGGVAVIDIGDSRFAGITIPTDEILLYIAEMCGFLQNEIRHVRCRRSKDGSPLKQVLLVLTKPQ